MCCDDDEGIEQQYNNQPTNVHVSHQGAQMQVVQTRTTFSQPQQQLQYGQPQMVMQQRIQPQMMMQQQQPIRVQQAYVVQQKF